jgi:hypothetical protein
MTNHHHFMGCAFDSLPGWTDLTTLTLTAPPEQNGEAAKLVVSREARRLGESVRTHSQRELLRLAARLPGFALLASEDFHVGGCRATRCLYRWKGEKGAVKEAVAFVEAPGEESAIVTLTCSSPRHAKVGCWAALKQLLATSSFDDLGDATLPWPLPASDPFAPPPAPSSPPPSPPVRNSGFYAMSDLPEIPMPRSAAPRRDESNR